MLKTTDAFLEFAYVSERWKDKTDRKGRRKKERWERGKEKDQKEKGEGEEQEEESKAHLKTCTGTLGQTSQMGFFQKLVEL